MSARPSCIEYPAGSRFVALRPELVEVCEGDGCAAAVLETWIGWTNHRGEQYQLDRGAMLERDDLWVYRSRQELRADVCGAWGVAAIDKAQERLLRLGFIERRNNPDHGWDRKLQHRLVAERVQDALNRLESHSANSKHASSEFGTCKLGDRSIDDSNSEQQYTRLSNETPLENLNRESSSSPKSDAQAEIEGGENLLDSQIERVGEFWAKATGREKLRLTPDRRDAIAEAMRHFTIEELERAIGAWRLDPYHRGENRTGKVFNDLPHLLRKPENIENLLGLAERGKVVSLQPRHDEHPADRRAREAMERMREAEPMVELPELPGLRRIA